MNIFGLTIPSFGLRPNPGVPIRVPIHEVKIREPIKPSNVIYLDKYRRERAARGKK